MQDQKKTFVLVVMGVLLILFCFGTLMRNVDFNERYYKPLTDLVQKGSSTFNNTEISKLLHNIKYSLGTYAKIEDLPVVNVKAIKCPAIIAGDKKEISAASSVQSNITLDLKQSNRNLYQLSQDCSNFLGNRKYMMAPVNKEEEEFPLAFSLLMFKDTFQAERLFRAIYRPQNLYCIHVDSKSAPEIHKTMENIASCFDNVFLASSRINVLWGRSTIAKAELVCLRDLVNHPKPWKYFINTCGQEFPLKTNLELVRVLKIFNGANDVIGRTFKAEPMWYGRIKYGFLNDTTPAKAVRYLKPEFPHNITWAKGATHAILVRGFAEFLFNSQVGKDFLNYIEDTHFNDEHLWNPIHFSPQLGAPGSYTGFPLITLNTNQSVVRYKVWGRNDGLYVCHGKSAKGVCVMSLEDLYQIVHSHKLFVNKFHVDYHPLAYDCLEEYIWNSTRLDIQGVDRLNTTFYKELPFIKNHI